jgi:hypothetical protein
MDKQTDNQKHRGSVQSAEAKELLRGILDTSIHSNCALIVQGSGPLMILDVSYSEMCDIMEERSEDEHGFIEVKTFQWTGQRNSEAFVHHKMIRVAWIIEVIQVTQEQWDAHLTEQVARQAQSIGG